MSDKEKHFAFVRRDLQYALSVLQVFEIVEAPELLPSHAALPGCLGTVAHRGELLPVLDPPLLARRPEGAPAPPSHFLVVRAEGAAFGLAMDRFVAIADLGERASWNNEELQAEYGPFVEAVLGFRDRSLCTLATAALAKLVKRNFSAQQLVPAGEVARANQRPSAALERRLFLCARIGNALLAVPIECVVEIIEGCDVTPLFKVPPLIRGLINLRGQVLACLDISDDFGFPPRLLEERNPFIVLKGDDAELALCVDKVTGIRRLSLAHFQKAETILSGDLTRYAAGVFEEPDGALFVLSVPAIFEAPQLQPYRRQ